VWRRHWGHGRRPWPHAVGPRRAVPGALPAAGWRSAAPGTRARGAPQATRRRGAHPAPAPGTVANTGKAGWACARLCEGVRAVGPGLPGAPEVGDEGVPPEALGGEDAGRGGQRSGARDGLEAGGEDVGRAPGRGTVAACHRGAAGEGHGVEGGPAAAAVAHEPGIVLLPPREAVRAVVCAGPGHTVGAPPGGAAQATAGLDEVRHGAPGGALGAEGGELVPGWAAQCARAGGRGGGRGGPARGPRVAGLGHGAWRDGPADEARRMAPRGPAAPLRACQAHRHRWAVAARAEGLAPGVPLGRALGQAQPLPVCRARGWEAALVGRRRPGAAHTGRTGGGGVWRQGCAPAVGSRGAKGHACWRSVKACERAGGAAASEEAWTNARAPADAQRGAQASRASAGLCVIRRGLCLLSLPAPCQVWTVSLQAGQSTYNGPAVVRRSR